MIKPHIFKIIGLIIFAWLIGTSWVLLKNNFFDYQNFISSEVITLWPSPSAYKHKPNLLKIQRKPALIIKPSPSPKQVLQEIIPSPSPDNEPWGVAKQLSEHTWTMKVQQDEVMTTTDELFAALNDYRKTKGVNPLQYDAILARYAQDRADYFTSIGKTDEHAGLNDFLKDDENFKKLGFASIGENSSYGYKMTGVHLIEWVYASDPGHDNNQLDPDWTHVGIGISATASELIFAGNKL